MKFKIKGDLIDVGGNQLRYSFRIDPLTPEAGAFTMMMYVHQSVKDRTRKEHRNQVAEELRRRHTALWERYHAWERKQWLDKNGPPEDQVQREPYDIRAGRAGPYTIMKRKR